MKKILSSLTFIFSVTMAFSQFNPPVTVTLKPDNNVGEDAIIFETHFNNGKDCTPNNFAQPAAQTNFGNDRELNFIAWTYNGGGCPRGTVRGLIRFAELSNIPPNAVISSATLVLHGPTTTGNWGNNLYPGTPLNNSNLGWVKRILPGSANAWTENGVTWNNQPATDPSSTNWVSIPVTNQRYGWNQSLDVTSMVADIVAELETDPDANNGFMLVLQNEIFYRSQIYASSDHSDRTLWPELVITYTDCVAANFSSCVSTDQPAVYDFTANNPNLSNYTWTVDGNYAGNGPTLNYDFNYAWQLSGPYKVCLEGESINSEKCQRCLEVCGSAYVKNGGMTYNGAPTGCNPIFTYCTSLPNNHAYTFTAEDPNMQGYTWRIDGVVVGTGPVLNYTFPGIGNHQVMLSVIGNNNASCFSYLDDFCVSPIYLYSDKKKSTKIAPNAPTGTMPAGDDPELAITEGRVTVSPNPTKDSWNIDYHLNAAARTEITVFDVSGKQIKQVTVNGNEGTNRYNLSASGIAPGVYWVLIRNGQSDTRLKVIKQ